MLEVHNVTRSFGDRRVLDDVSFAVRPGRLTGFVGGNGAGKTTTMRIILGVLAADGGTVTLAGRPVTEGDRRRFGHLGSAQLLGHASEDNADLRHPEPLPLTADDEYPPRDGCPHRATSVA